MIKKQTPCRKLRGRKRGMMMKKRFFSILLCLCMVLSMLPAMVFAATQYTITYVFDYGTLPADRQNPEMINEDGFFLLPDLEDCGQRQFLGWQIQDSDDIDVYSAGQEYAPSKSMTFVAVYDEYITLTVPFTTTVTLDDYGVPGETAFELAIVDVNAGEELYANVTVSGTVTTTDGAGNYDGTLTFTGPFQQLWDMLSEGAFVQQVDVGADGWTYDHTVWGLLLTESASASTADNVNYTMLVLTPVCEETSDGVRYNIDWDAINWDAPQSEDMRFTNTYSAHAYELKHDATNHWDECGCGDVQNEEPHRYGEWKVTKEATETEAGEKVHTCSVCDYLEKETIPMLEYTLEHDETGHWKKGGNGDFRDKEAHKYGEWKITKKATETEKGEKVHTCSVCGYEETEEIAKLTAGDTTNSGTSAPQSGDNSNLALWLVLLAVSAAGGIGTGVYSKRRKISRAK